MAVVKDTKPAAVDHSLDITAEPGFHVVVDGKYSGTYDTREDAQAYIDGQIVPQDLDGEIVEGPAA